MKKRIMSVLLALVMALSLCTVALADPATGDGAGDSTTTTIDTIAFTLTGYAYGATSGTGVTCTTNSTNPSFPGISAVATIVTFGGSNWNEVTGPLREGTQHYTAKVVYSAIAEDGFAMDTSVVPTMTCNGTSCQLVNANNNSSTAAPTADQTGNYTAYFALPELTVTTATETINFVKTVVKGGNVVPPVTTFTFEQVTTGVNVNFNDGQSADNIQVPAAPQVTVTIDPIETDGNADYLGTIKVTGPQIDVEQFLRDGFYVREKNPGAENWTYDDQVWLVQCKALSDVAGDLNVSVTDSTNDHVIVAKKVVWSAGQNCYVPAENAKWCRVENMTFTNVYTKNVHRVPSSTTPTAKIEAPKTFDAGIAVYGVMAVSSLFGMGYVGKKKF